MADFLLKEDGQKLLQETGDGILLEVQPEVELPKPIVIKQAVNRASTY